MPVFLGFPGGSAGKEPTCNVRDVGSIPGLGRSPEDGNSYPLQYPWGRKESDTTEQPPLSLINYLPSGSVSLLITFGKENLFKIAFQVQAKI